MQSYTAVDAVISVDLRDMQTKDLPFHTHPEFGNGSDVERYIAEHAFLDVKLVFVNGIAPARTARLLATLFDRQIGDLVAFGKTGAFSVAVKVAEGREKTVSSACRFGKAINVVRLSLYG